MSRKRKKEDRAKTQLKKPKTAPGKHLPKGTNETKTEFKVTKIVIPGQLSSSSSTSDGPTTKKNVGIKDLLSKLAHFSQAVRADGLEGLKELLSTDAAASLVNSNLSKIITKLVSLLLDKEKKIRKLSVTLLGMTLGHVSESHVSPLYSLMSAHLACCLTHIDPRIQQDGLALLDTFIEKAPSFVESNYSSILPNCLDQISNKKGGGNDKNKGPSVAANVSENMTALQWRLAVLSRVDKILELAVSNKTSVSEEKINKSVQYSAEMFYPVIEKTCEQNFTLADLAETSHTSSIPDNIFLIIPLLIETWIEARASETTKSKNANISNECCDLLLHIAGILDKLLTIVTKSFDTTDSKKIFSGIKDKFWSDIKQHLLKYLPYKSPNISVDKCSSLLSCVNIILDPEDHVPMSDVAIKMCASKHVPVQLKIRITQGLLAKVELTVEQKDLLISSIINLAENTDSDSDKQSLLEILQNEAVASPDAASASVWIDSLPSRLIKCQENEQQILLNVCLKLVQTSNKTLASNLLSSWDNILTSCEANVNLGQTLNYVNYYCKALSS